ncbi:MAG: sugar phosphate isomerase/epimerase [Acidimicrobiales bacterium]
MALGAWDAVLCSGTLDRHATFEQRIAAASSGGFKGISLWGRDYRAARVQGLSDADMRIMLDDAGLQIAELDLAWWWLPGASEIHIPARFDAEELFAFGEEELFSIADSLGARSLNAVDVFGGSWSLDDAADAFAALCYRALEHGLLVHIEFLPWSKIPDLRTALEVVSRAGQPNGGIAIDAWHYFRGSPEPGLLETIPAHMVACVQLSDAPATPEEDLPNASLHERLLPGEGDFDIVTLMTDLRSIGTACPIGVEVFSDRLHELPPAVIGEKAGRSLRSFLST